MPMRHPGSQNCPLLQDLYKPEGPRLRRHLSAILNFAMFREVRQLDWEQLGQSSLGHVPGVHWALCCCRGGMGVHCAAALLSQACALPCVLTVPWASRRAYVQEKLAAYTALQEQLEGLLQVRGRSCVVAARRQATANTQWQHQSRELWCFGRAARGSVWLTCSRLCGGQDACCNTLHGNAPSNCNAAHWVIMLAGQGGRGGAERRAAGGAAPAAGGAGGGAAAGADDSGCVEDGHVAELARGWAV